MKSEKNTAQSVIWAYTDIRLTVKTTTQSVIWADTDISLILKTTTQSVIWSDTDVRLIARTGVCYGMIYASQWQPLHGLWEKTWDGLCGKTIYEISIDVVVDRIVNMWVVIGWLSQSHFANADLWRSNLRGGRPHKSLEVCDLVMYEKNIFPAASLNTARPSNQATSGVASLVEEDG